jgi:CRP-like cAMP-binding protein
MQAMAVERMLRFRSVGTLSAPERARLESAISDRIDLPARHTAVREGVELSHSTLLVEGFMARCIDDRAGYRQVVAVHVPGDFVDLHAYPLHFLDHDIVTLTPAHIALVPHTELFAIQREWPVMSRTLWAATLLDAAIHRQWVFRQGRLDATGRIAHFLCEINARLFAIGLSDGLSFPLPLTQTDIAEACGLTSVHVNRVLRELRDGGLCTVRTGRVMLHDARALVAMGQFTPGYLYLDDQIIAQLKRLGAA